MTNEELNTRLYEKMFAEQEPVSYTHLDVYKRQEEQPASPEQADLQPKKEEALPLPPKRPRRERITFTLYFGDMTLSFSCLSLARSSSIEAISEAISSQIGRASCRERVCLYV